MNEKQRLSEQTRREAAQAAAGSGVELGAREVPARSMKQMLSVRFEPELLHELRRLARDREVSVSDLLREAAMRLLEEARQQQVYLTVHQNAGSSIIEPHVTVLYWDGHRTHQTSDAS